jgi:hypothetical protein
MQIMVSNSGVFTFVTVRVSSAGGESERATVEVPFDFMVGERVLHSGIYHVENSGTPGLLRFRSQTEAHEEALVQTINGKRAESMIPEKLLFLVQQNTYYLGQALMA